MTPSFSGETDCLLVSLSADVFCHLRDLPISLHRLDTRDWSALLSVCHCVVLGVSDDCEPRPASVDDSRLC